MGHGCVARIPVTCVLHIVLTLTRDNGRPSDANVPLQSARFFVDPHIRHAPQPLMAESFVALGSTSSALPIQSTLLHRIKTWPSVPELTPLTNSSVLESWMFM
ncbi:hypothetical protein J1614_008956 [Plenodomus biglobosus]|nr:hypothetical protein J1614_008956 [Plenodomus biglobosus]